MSAKLTRIHLGLGLSEIGVQFETLDANGVATSKQRAFVVVDDAVLAPVWAAAEAALAAAIDELPLEFPPSAVTTALMQKRTALAEAEQARQQRVEAEAAVQAAERAKALIDAEIAEKRSELAKLGVPGTVR